MENLHKSGKMTDLEFSVYCEWYWMIVQNMEISVDLIGG